MSEMAPEAQARLETYLEDVGRALTREGFDEAQVQAARDLLADQVFDRVAAIQGPISLSMLERILDMLEPPDLDPSGKRSEADDPDMRDDPSDMTARDDRDASAFSVVPDHETAVDDIAWDKPPAPRPEPLERVEPRGEKRSLFGRRRSRDIETGLPDDDPFAGPVTAPEVVRPPSGGGLFRKVLSRISLLTALLTPVLAAATVFGLPELMDRDGLDPAILVGIGGMLVAYGCGVLGVAHAAGRRGIYASAVLAVLILAGVASRIYLPLS